MLTFKRYCDFLVIGICLESIIYNFLIKSRKFTICITGKLYMAFQYFKYGYFDFCIDTQRRSANLLIWQQFLYISGTSQ